MPNLYDYLTWRGDLSLKQDPFNDIDAMILSRISYLPFDGIVPAGFKESIGMSEADEALAAAGDSANYIIYPDRNLLPAVAATERYKNMRLSGFVNQIDDAIEKQFSAMIIEPGDGTYFVSFRGTDNTLIGWKEDFNMSFMTEVPAQIAAVKYLAEAAGPLWGKLILGGHSKGGNLAVYAASYCPPRVQRRILKIYNYDGPGFHSEILASQGYEAVRDKIYTVVPQSSIVGMLMEHEEDYTIIQSSESGFMQHDLYTWDVMGKDFIYLDAATSSSRFMDNTLRSWLSGLSTEERSVFVDSLYSIINATNAGNLKELTAKKWYEHAKAGLKAIIDLDEHTRSMLGKAIFALLKTASGNLDIFMPEFMQKKSDFEGAEKGDEGGHGT